MPTARLHVQDLHDEQDERRLEQTVRRVTGVYGVVASCRNHCMEIDFDDDEVRVDEIVTAAGTAGFDARLVG